MVIDVCRYVLGREAPAPRAPGKLGKAADKAHELSDLLGDHHELTVLREDATGRAGLLQDTGTALEELIARRQVELVRHRPLLRRAPEGHPPSSPVSRYPTSTPASTGTRGSSG